MWISKKKWREQNKKIADLEEKFQSQQKVIRKIVFLIERQTQMQSEEIVSMKQGLYFFPEVMHYKRTGTYSVGPINATDVEKEWV